MTREMPPQIIATQFVQRHPRERAIKPPINGPITGAFMGAIAQMENARGRCSSSTTSETVLGPLDSMTAPATALIQVRI